MSSQHKEALEWIHRLLITILIGIGAWFAKEIWTGQRDLSQRMEERMQKLELFQASTTANRFTSGDASQLRASVLELINGHDKRIARNEDYLLRIDKSLTRIEEKLGTSPH